MGTFSNHTSMKHCLFFRVALRVATRALSRLTYPKDISLCGQQFWGYALIYTGDDCLDCTCPQPLDASCAALVAVPASVPEERAVAVCPPQLEGSA